MTGALLKSGSLTAFHPVGAVGNPVYLAASQLRAAIARRLGAEVADTFAIPQRNQEGDAVDWYAPRPGPVVPWSAASDSERADAQQRLLEVRTQIEDLGRQMEAEASPERQVFGRLLAQVMSFPDDDDVHLVDGQPVLTFWGFVKDRAAIGSDPLRSLDMHLAETQITPARRSLPWWAWALLGLLLLLALLLAISTLRGCEAPRPVADATRPASGEEARQLTGIESASDALIEPPAEPMAEPMAEPIAESGIEPTTPVQERAAVAKANQLRIDRDSLIDRGGRGVVDVDQADADAADPTLLDGIDAEPVVDGIADGDADGVVVGGVDPAVDGVGDDAALAVGADATLGDNAVAAEDEDTEASLALDEEGLADEPADAGAAAATDDIRADTPDAAIETELADAATVAEEAGTDTTDQTTLDAETGLEGAATPEQAAADDQAAASGGDARADGRGVETAAPSAEAPNAAESAQAGDSAATAFDLDPARSAAASARAAAEEGSSDGTSSSASAGTGTRTVRIPPKRLLSSSWRTSTTLLDPKDGSPIHLDYRLKDGAGKLRLTRKDGSVCESGASARVQDDRLLVDSATEILCADGTSFGRPRIDCTPQADGRARCVGRYADGSTFPLDMQQQP